HNTFNAAFLVCRGQESCVPPSISTRFQTHLHMKLPADSFVVFNVTAGEITLSATNMINFQYAGKYCMTLSEGLNAGEIVYFRI
ncbi:MAG TPA: hypothetical protein VEP71_04160, partial [Gallionella sp.]|nr:hypothetical protein [Gallionella sp.]